MDSTTYPVLPGTLFKCSDLETDTLEIDYPSIVAMTKEDRDNLSPIEYRFLKWVLFEEPQLKDRLTVFCFERTLPDVPDIFDWPQSEVCAIILEHLGIPLPIE